MKSYDEMKAVDEISHSLPQSSNFFLCPSAGGITNLALPTSIVPLESIQGMRPEQDDPPPLLSPEAYDIIAPSAQNHS